MNNLGSLALVMLSYGDLKNKEMCYFLHTQACGGSSFLGTGSALRAGQCAGTEQGTGGGGSWELGPGGTRHYALEFPAFQVSFSPNCCDSSAYLDLSGV